jgi:hypothetical protein
VAVPDEAVPASVLRFSAECTRSCREYKTNELSTAMDAVRVLSTVRPWRPRSPNSVIAQFTNLDNGFPRPLVPASAAAAAAVGPCVAVVSVATI